jgi:hypothetical protein
MYLDPNIPTHKNLINLNVFVNKLDDKLLRKLKLRVDVNFNLCRKKQTRS